MNSGLYGVITTIQEPTDAVLKLVSSLRKASAKLLVIGDKKGPESYKIDGIVFLALKDQLESQFDLARRLPVNHYGRKNVGYLYAISQGASCIYETDDDNAPLDGWRPRNEYMDNVRVVDGKMFDWKQEGRWLNVYRYFSDENIWPRGLPLNEIHSSVPETISPLSATSKIRSPIQQGLVNGSPDVDAIWRLVLDHPFNFENHPSILLPPGNWSPFNTQSTWWWPIAYPLLYIPSYCTFRMCDIWKSFVAQRCLWELDLGVTFHGPEVFQERNPHDLMADFRDEIPGYDRNKELVEVLENTCLEQGDDKVAENLRSCYEALVKAKFFPEKELELIDAWLLDLSKIGAM